MRELAERMMRLFDGYREAHGTHGKTSRNLNKGGKLEIKKTARTVTEPVTLELWEMHLSGKRPLGIIPIRKDNTCVWGCIDIDKYDISHAEIVREVKRLKMPLTICRTKSGGAHAYLFLSEPAPAEDVRTVLQAMASKLGYGDCEIFPKQSRILSERGDVGNWLNMPYLNYTHTERYAVKENMTAYELWEFLDIAEKSRIRVEDSLPDEPQAPDDPLSDGPPCLQHLTKVGFPEGTRNRGLFALGIFCQRKYGSSWQDRLEEFNRDTMSPPLPADEVTQVIRSLEKKEYHYSCKDDPLASYCNSSLCRMRKHGVGGGQLYPVISGLSKLETDPPLWFIDIEDTRVELNTNELQNYRDFQKACMEKLTVMYLPMKAETWSAMVGEAMANAIIIEASPEMSRRGHFMEILETFLTDRHRGELKEDLLLGKPWQDPDTGHHHFRLKDLMEALDQSGFRFWGRNKVGQHLDEIGGRKGLNIRGKYVSTFWVTDDFSVPTEEHELPEIDEPPI